VEIRTSRTDLIHAEYMEVNEEITIRAATVCSKHFSIGKIDREEFCWKALDLFFQSAAPEWERLMACFTQSQGELLRGFVDESFSNNDYGSRVWIFPGMTEAEKQAAIERNRPKWIEIHRWIVQATGGERF